MLISGPQRPREIAAPVKKSPLLRVLIVDDEPLIRWSLSETLTESGHAVVEAGDGESALHALNGGAPFDVILLDYRLPDSNDLRLLRKIRRVAPYSAVIMMTAHGTPEVVEAALDLGVQRVVPKPFEVHDIAELVLQVHVSASTRSGS